MTDTSNTRTSRPGSTLHRSGHERIFAGVAGGLGEHFGINAWWFRWAFIFLTLFAGVGVLIYILAWVVIPGPDEDEPIVAGWVQGVDWSDGGTVFGIVLVGVAVVLFATQVIHVSGLLVLAAVLSLIGVLLYRGDLIVPQRTRGTTPPPIVGATLEAEVAADSEAVGPSASAVEKPGSPPPTPASQPPRPPRVPRERSMLGRLTIAIGLIVVASMALLDLSDLAVDIDPFHYFAAVIAVLGTGLLIGAWVGRARWLIIIGVIVTPMLWIAMLLPTSWDFSAGEFHHIPLTVEEVQGIYEQGVGQMTIDLTNLSPADLAEIGTIKASLTLGEMVVNLPDDVGVVLHADVSAGEVTGPFRTISGLGVDVTREFGPEPIVLVLDLEVGAGVVTISGPAGVFDSSEEFIIEWSSS